MLKSMNNNMLIGSLETTFLLPQERVFFLTCCSYHDSKSMPLCPLQTSSPMKCCKHLSHIGPPWPNGLPGLPEAVQQCLFADTVLPCRTCCRLKTTSKVRQRNKPVRSRVCNPWFSWSPAIYHPTCLLETLAQPNCCVSVTTERSTDV